MAGRNELVEAALAANANGSTTRKGTELSSRAAYVAIGGAGPSSGRSTTTSAACSRRSRTGQGEVPRRARHTLAGRFAAGHPLCAAHLPAEAGIRSGGPADSGIGHRGYDGDVHGDQQRAAEAASLPGAGAPSDTARIQAGFW